MPNIPNWLKTWLKNLKYIMRRIAPIARILTFLAVGCGVCCLVFSLTFIPILIASLGVTIVAAVSALLFKDSLSYALLNLVKNAIAAEDDFSDFKLEGFSSHALYFLATPVIGLATALMATSMLSYVAGAKVGFAVIQVLDFITKPLVHWCAEDPAETAYIEDPEDGTISFYYDNEHDDPGYIPPAPVIQSPSPPPPLFSYAHFKQRLQTLTGIDLSVANGLADVDIETMANPEFLNLASQYAELLDPENFLLEENSSTLSPLI